jgi:Glutathione S-transferase, C-terminal domain
VTNLKISFHKEIAQAHYETEEAAKVKKFEVLNAETIPFYLTKLDEIAAENNGFFANKKVNFKIWQLLKLKLAINEYFPIVSAFVG